ncbi:hypothetical protein X777_06535 [Ooceraea biroi]|uniref:Uncharacterized protein n=1 Tax=Ooceraea biroi TaxID=2015173 RepID=A0A026WEK0_OOCBI|nr:hypothetical protein X777_06535 [Ooceraea biroi]
MGVPGTSGSGHCATRSIDETGYYYAKRRLQRAARIDVDCSEFESVFLLRRVFPEYSLEKNV